MIDEWKSRYGAIFAMVDDHGVEYVFRPLTILELHQLNGSSLSSVEVEELAVQMAVLSPTEFDVNQMSAGFVSVLAEQIYDCSGLNDAKVSIGIFETKRQDMQEITNQMKAFVLAAIPAYTEEDLDKFTYHVLSHKVALSEEIFRIQQGLFGIADAAMTFQIVDPEEEARRQEEEEKKQAAKKKAAWDRLMKQGHMDPDKAPVVAPDLKEDDPILRKLMGG